MDMDDIKVIDFGLAAPFCDGESLKESVGTLYCKKCVNLYFSFCELLDNSLS